MNLNKILFQLKNTGQSFLATSDAMALLDIRKDHASHILSRLEEAGHLVKLKRGIWCFPEKTAPYVAAGLVTSPFPSYISLQSALYHHGMISQIPGMTYCVSIARTHLYRTALGDISTHHISEDFFFGYHEDSNGAKIASPEKALLDFFYLSPAKTGLFCTLPELEIPKKFSVKRAKHMINKLPASRRKSILEGKFHDMLSVSSRV
ncbi:MAG: hypothetical protein WCP55_06835 [Lentisphaerota bacterium]|jgi:predicted transcriptional regulator of viral defense system